MNGIKISKLIAGLILLNFLSIYMFKNEAYSAGFDCTKASTDVEKYICSSTTFSRLDEIMSDAYSIKLKNLTPSEQDILKKEQLIWLEKRNSCLNYIDPGSCMFEEYQKRIIALGGIKLLMAYYDERCRIDDWQCDTAGELAASQGDLELAAQYYGSLCDAHHDGEYGVSCYKQAVALEKLGNIDEAKAIYIDTCERHEHNESCYAAQRLTTGIDKNDNWAGLYRSPRGTVLITKESDGIYSVRMDTQWAYGSGCGYSGSITVNNDEVTASPDELIPECVPKIEKEGSVLSFKDPTRQCQRLCGSHGSFAETFHKEE